VKDHHHAKRKESNEQKQWEERYTTNLFATSAAARVSAPAFVPSLFLARSSLPPPTVPTPTTTVPQHAPMTATKQQQNAVLVFTFLRNIHLDQYSTLLIQNGFDSLVSLKT